MVGESCRNDNENICDGFVWGQAVGGEQKLSVT